MRILVLGAGGTGGYFGGRLAAAGSDVTFLVRPPRARRLRQSGLHIRSPLGDAQLAPSLVTEDELPAAVARQAFDLVLLSCKAYDLDTAMAAVRPAIGADTTVLPILNGLAHYPALDQQFGAARVLAGLCYINATVAADDAILHLDPMARLVFGERRGASDSPRALALQAICQQAGIDVLYSPQIGRESWTKFSFLSALAAGTCLLRGSVGAIVAAEGGGEILQGLYQECLAVAVAAGEPVPDTAQARVRDLLARPGSSQTSSMLRDLRAGRRLEAQQLVGDMLARAKAAGQAAPLLGMAWAHLQVYLHQLEQAATA